MKETAIEVVKRAYKENIYVQMTSGYRSFAEQNKLYAKGRTASGKIVTNAKAGQSNHNYGLAVDYVLYLQMAKQRSGRSILSGKESLKLQRL
ncbi:M15 family metallopeptidase [Bacillus sp. WMMC1349]|uniref:M15 family metallopeptidase n=1 Tax=Bacillus sp. WMMC1349 TaxID=2736254 RepID=UPI002815863E|nr:M15 family metallopeptidase [Bacillus sp. WMMC1349]